jgi:hypothetical protein
VGSSGLKLRLSSSTDPEPGRCKRTDGKKWRCSRDVAPDHKYCERHLHRGRPRSRKPVEVHANNDNIKRSRREDYQALPTPSVSAAIPNPSINTSGFSSQFLGPTTCQPYHQPTVVSVASHNEPRWVYFFFFFLPFFESGWLVGMFWKSKGKRIEDIGKYVLF